MTLYGDKDAIQRMISILLDNAVRYSDDGGRIQMRLYHRRGRICVEVCNTCDLPDITDLDRLFDRFYRMDESRSVTTGGTGIGLSMVRAIAETHGGKATVQSADGKRICFKVVLWRKSDKIVHQKNTVNFRYILGKPFILYPCFWHNTKIVILIVLAWNNSEKSRKGVRWVSQAEKFRHEMKYRIGYAQYMELRNRLRTVMRSDLHTGADGRYLIRSIYFDNYMDKALREKRDGVPRREKFRIRYYNDDFSYLTLEKKIKDNDLCMKVDARITEEECRELLDGRTNWMREHSSRLMRELYAKMHYLMIRPGLPWRW